MSALTIGLLGLGILLFLLAIGLPVGYTMAAVGLTGFIYLGSLQGGLTMAARAAWDQFGSYSFSVVPLFILMGQIAFASGISRRLYNAAHKWFGHMRGGLAMATVGACAGFAAVCGSSTATAATMGMVALPEMKRFKYDPGLATGCIAAGGSMGILIPPSVILIVYGIMTQQSIGKLFAAGFIPGIMEATFYIITIAIICRINPNLGPRGPKTPLREKVKGLWGGTIETLIIFLLVIGGIFAGWFTPTEAAGVGASLVLLMSIVLKHISWKGFQESVLSTTSTTAMILIIVVGALIFNKFVAITRLPYVLADWVVSLNMPPLAVMGLIIFVYLVGGCFMDALGLILLTVPIFFPVALQLGFDPIWFGIIITRVSEIGVITPPVGINVYIIKGVAPDVPLFTIFRGITPFLVADVIAVFLLLLIPEITLFLPSIVSY
ncbi:MAG: TRAP transporter large permease [Deltaproteobacteria bacterium]|nr:TRAP transporter large permease [Deltaproteobacteria bacterium]